MGKQNLHEQQWLCLRVVYSGFLLNSFIGLIKELVKEVSKLERELAETREKLRQTGDKLKAVTSGGTKLFYCG